MASHVDLAFDAAVEDGLGFGLKAGALGWAPDKGGDGGSNGGGGGGRALGGAADDFENVPRVSGGGGSQGRSLAGRLWGALGMGGGGGGGGDAALRPTKRGPVVSIGRGGGGGLSVVSPSGKGRANPCNPIL